MADPNPRSLRWYEVVLGLLVGLGSQQLIGSIETNAFRETKAEADAKVAEWRRTH